MKASILAGPFPAALRHVICVLALFCGLPVSMSRAEAAADIPGIIPADARNLAYLAQKIRDGKTVSVGFIGGSITQGAGTKKHADSYYWKTKARLSEFAGKFGARVEPRLSAVGGTGSDYGAHRMGLQLLDKDVDLLIVEFAVNDFQNPTALDGLEGIVRQTLARNPHAAIVLFYTANRRMIEEYYNKGLLPPSVIAFHRVARHYNLAEVNAGSRLREAFESGNFVPDAFFPDKTHPTAEGHAFYADVLSGALIAALESSTGGASVDASAGTGLPPPLGSGRYERAGLLAISPLRKEGEWTREDPGYYTYFGLWKADAPGASMTFHAKGERVALLCGKFTSLRVTGPGIDKVLSGPGRANGIPTLQILFDGNAPIDGPVTVTVEPDAKGNSHAEIAGLAVIQGP